MIGDFASVEELREKIKQNLLHEKEMKEKDKRRVDLMEQLIEKSTIELPRILIEGELEKMLAQFKDDLAHSGVTYENYLAHIKKTEADIKAEWQETAVKRAKSQIILNEIAKKEGIAPQEEDIQKQMDHILSHHKDAERFRVRMYVETFLTNDLVFAFLEKSE
jgi:trigger factor